MQATITITFLALCLSAPWISRKWGTRGGWVWFIISLGSSFQCSYFSVMYNHFDPLYEVDTSARQ